ncbi:MAG: TolC family protein [Bacteroidetes bacterium]|nr:TolC family protein [Bacteroidota bacterium]
MTQKSYLTIVVMLVFFTTNLAAQKKIWTLQECINKALQSNIKLQQLKLQQQNQNISYNQNRMQMLPSLNASSALNYNYGRNIDPFTNQYLNQVVQSNSIQLQANWTLFNGFQIQNNIKQNKSELEAWELDLKSNSNDIALLIANQYLQILLAIEIEATMRSQLALSQNQADRSQKLYDAGKISEGDLMQLKAQMSNDEYNLLNAENSVKSAYINMWLTMNEQPDTNNIIEIPNTLNPSTNNNIDALYIFMNNSANRPEVISGEKRVQSAMYAFKSAEGSRYPRLVLFGNISSLYSSSRKDITGYQLVGIDPSGFVGKTFDTVYTPRYKYETQTTAFGKQISDNFGRSFGLSLSIPIFNAGSAYSNVQRAKINVANQQLNLEQTKRNLYKNIAQACIDLSNAQQKYIAARKNFDAQEKSYSFAKIRYDNGSLSYTDFTIQLNNKVRAEATWIQSRYELIFRQKAVEFYEGKTITF